jgi:hypothetical protein
VKQLKTRIAKLEGAAPQDDPFGAKKMTDHDLEVALHDVRLAMIASNEISEQERARLRAELQEREDTVRSWLAFYRRPDIAASIASNRARGFHGYLDKGAINSEALAEGWGIT